MTPAASLASDPSLIGASPTPAGATTTAVLPAEKAAATEKKPSAKTLAKYDTNKDGVLEPEEKAARKKDHAARKEQRIKKYDKNGDGKLDADEKAAMKADKAAKAEKKADKAQ